MSTVIGSLRLDDGVGTVRMEDVYDTSAADLWEAISDPTRLSRWLVDITGVPEVGAVLRAHFTSSWDGTIRVDVCEPQKHLSVTSTEDDSDQEPMTIEAWITPDGPRTRLVIEERGFRRDQLAPHGAGWQVHLDDLGWHLTSGKPEGDWSDRWRALIAEYEEKADSLG